MNLCPGTPPGYVPEHPKPSSYTRLCRCRGQSKGHCLQPTQLANRGDPGGASIRAGYQLPEVVGAFDLPPCSRLSAPGPQGANRGSCGAAEHWGARGWLGRDSECLHPKFSRGRSHVYTDTPASNEYKHRYTLTKPALPRGMCAAFPVNKV